ncbi:hypothetical protein BCF74_1095 [Knoellia remsis]|uniref:Uncharacterized protein n=1 Tax=Knoellia remsis TaxID=407159 RepID=A0A2T0UNH2_9MICO|nr:hypothetical protein BCF74_1095 [Knoellia remsis]
MSAARLAASHAFGLSSSERQAAASPSHGHVVVRSQPRSSASRYAFHEPVRACR